MLDVGVIGDGTMTIEDGGHVQSGLSVIADLASSSGSAIVRGPGSTWTVNGLLLKVGDDGDGTLTIEHGGSVNATDSFIAAAQGSTGTATVTGNGSTWTNSGEFIVGDNGNGILRIEAGGKVQNTNGFLGFDNNPPFVAGKVTVAGANSEWVNSGSLFIGGGMTATGGPGVLAIEPGGTVRVGDTLKIWNEGTVKLLGGTIHFDSDGYYREPTGALNFLAGTVELAGDRDIGLDPVIDGFFGAAPLIPSGKALVVQGAATLLTQLTLDGGTLTVGELASGALLDLQRGTLNITNQAVDVQAGGTFGERLELRPDMVINIEQGLTNRGLITGNGTLGGPVSNDVFGEVRATSGNALVFTGTNFDNNGQMVLLGGLVEANALSNTPAGRITGRGTLVLGGGGLVNKGHVALSNGITDLFGDVTNNTGVSSVGITVSGNADVTFWDDVTNTSGLFRVAAGSSATFFGAFSGAGISGAGDVYLEADITPGFSPALAQFGGDVHFGPLTDLNIEIGGTNKGAAYDALEIAGTALLDGTLDVTLVGGFTTTLGEVFEILRASDGVNGTFAAESLPQLGSLLALQILYDANSVMLAVVPALPGDFNANGVVDAADYVLWRKSDGTQDGYNIWRTHFGETIAAVGSFATPGSNAQATIVPEPMNHLLLFATPLLTVMLYRRRINSEKSSRPA